MHRRGDVSQLSVNAYGWIGVLTKKGEATKWTELGKQVSLCKWVGQKIPCYQSKFA